MFIPKGFSYRGLSVSHWIYAGVIDKMGTNEIIRLLREKGLGYHKETMNNDIRAYRIAQEGSEAVQRLPSHVTIPQDYFIEAKEVTIPVRYLYTYREVKTNTETGETSESYYTAGGDILESKGDIFIRMANQAYLDEYYPNIQIDEQEIVNVYKGGKK